MMKFKIRVILCKPHAGHKLDEITPFILYGFVSNTGKFYSFGELDNREFLPYSLIPEIIEDLSHFFKKNVAYDTFDDDEYAEFDPSEYHEILYEETIYTP